MANVKLFGNLREIAGLPAVEIPGGTVGEVLSELVRQYSALQEALFEGDAVKPFLRVMINGQDMELAQGLQTAVADSSSIAIFPPLAGGRF